MSILFSIFVFIMVLGVLVFFHELGHFVAAKACGIYVDRFSLGMPPRIAGIRLGETDYCLGALPIGGYVKMAGQEDTPLSEEEREQTYGKVPPERWFNNKPVWQRFIVIVAGPLMNLVLAVLLYGVLAAMGSEVPEMEVSGRLGMIAPDSPAASAPLYEEHGTDARATMNTGTPDATGWQTGDVVLEIDGKPVHKFSDIALAALLGGENRVFHVRLERELANGERKRYVSPITPAIAEGDEHPRFGVLPFETAIVADLIEGMPAKEAGLLPGDEIQRLNGALVDRSTFVKATESTPEGAGVEVEIRRGSETLSFHVVPQTIGRVRDVLYGVDDDDQTMEEREPAEVLGLTDEAKDKTSLQRKDVIVAANGNPVTAKQFDELVRHNPGGTIEIKVERPAILYGVIQGAETRTLNLSIDPVRAIGIDLRAKMVRKLVPATQIVPEAFRQSYEALALVMQTLQALVTRTVSPRNLGGPLMIAGAASHAAEEGLYWLVRLTAFISINLCVFNLLPLPVLDGGIILLQAIEALRRRPLSIRFQERFQMAGLFLILFLMVFVTYHDVRRWIEGLMP